MVEKVREFVRANGPAALTDRYAIKCNRHGRYPNLHMFKYHQIDSPMHEPIVQKCRGLILDADRDWGVVSYPYDKFFNHGEGHAASIDWTTARVLEKADGSLMTLYWYDGQWQVASSGMPDAAGDVYGQAMTFADLFWETWSGLGYSAPLIGTDACYMFELMTKHNRIVIQHPQPRIVLHGARDLSRLREQHPAPIAALYGWECIKSYDLTGWDGVIAAASALKGVDGEGFVVCDAQFRRVKVKSPAYVAISHMKDGMNLRRMLEIVRTGEGGEVLAHFPEWRAEHDAVHAKYGALMRDVESAWETHRGIGEQKAFALAVKGYPFSGALFARRAGKIASFSEWAVEMPIRRLEDLVGLQDRSLVGGD